MFSGDVNMCRSIVIGRMARKAMNAITWPSHHQRCHVWSVVTEAPSTSWLSGQPTKLHFS